MHRLVALALVTALVIACGDLVVVQRAGSDPIGTPGVWQDVTPAALDVSYEGGRYGVGDVLVDAARPSDLYAFTDYEGVWRSTDYGSTWSLVSTGRNGDVLASGRLWGAAMDHDRARDPSTPPTLFVTNAYGTVQGLYRSSNGGIDWDYILLPEGINEPYPQAAYALDVDPYDPQHVLLAYSGRGMSESIDGGTTFRPIASSEAILGDNPQVFFVDTGTAESTARTWLSIAQWATNADGVHLTTDRGATWAQVATFEHPPGGAQLFNAGAGVVYLPGIGSTEGIYRSDDAGAHWMQISALGASTIIGTATQLYAGGGWATEPPVDPMLRRAARSDETSWTSLVVPGLINGPKRIAATSDGVHTILVSGSFNAGIWRYVEP